MCAFTQNSVTISLLYRRRLVVVSKLSKPCSIYNGVHLNYQLCYHMVTHVSHVNIHNTNKMVQSVHTYKHQTFSVECQIILNPTKSLPWDTNIVHGKMVTDSYQFSVHSSDGINVPPWICSMGVLYSNIHQYGSYMWWFLWGE